MGYILYDLTIDIMSFCGLILSGWAFINSIYEITCIYSTISPTRNY